MRSSGFHLRFQTRLTSKKKVERKLAVSSEFITSSIEYGRVGGLVAATEKQEDEEGYG